MDLFNVFGQTDNHKIQEEQLPNEEIEQENTPLNNDINLIQDFQINHSSEDVGCFHESFTPQDYVPIQRQTTPAKSYQFKLDPFQVEAVKVLEKNESVLVAAHTSAGKTAVAEYAIAMAKRDGQRVVYTSPIKALSNQKYRELLAEFDDVGLVTGDVTINQNAFCLVMTTEILRSMLYRGSEIIREVAWVIFDEVHYMRDRERGVVWEETIILLSQNVKFVFLSATIPNASQFCEWICRIKHQPCHVIYTEFRPIPLQHYLCPSGSDGIYLVVDEFQRFREDQFQKCISHLEGEADLLNTKKKKPTEGSDLFKLLKLIKERDFVPAIIFSFSKREVEGYALSMSKLDFTNAEEKENIEKVYTQSMKCLSEEDRELPQIQSMLPILKKGIGIHHGGLLPIVKEVIEILFQEGWIKALFSTETFSMGVNMPSRTVVFTSVRKFDGESFRWIGGGEYIQMSGRAGRRGIDNKGYCLLMFDEKLDQDVAKNMLKGNSDPLNSAFHLSYNMLLNTLRLEDTDPEYIIRRSFHQFQNEKSLPEMKKKLEELRNQRDEIKIEKEDLVGEYNELKKSRNNIEANMRSIINRGEIILPFLAIGRLVYIKSNEFDWGWGVYLNFMQKKIGIKKGKSNKQEQTYILDVMLHIQKRRKNEQAIPCNFKEDGEMDVIAVMLDNVHYISSVKLNLPQNLKSEESKSLVKQTIIKVMGQMQNKLPLLDPIKDMKINDEKLDQLVEKKEKLIGQEKELVNQYPEIEQEQKSFEQKMKICQSIKMLSGQIEQSSQMVLSDDLRKMKRVLRRLEFISKDEIVQMKGMVACEVSACDEIMITELLFSGIFNETSSEEAAGLLTCLIFDENSSGDKLMIKHDGLNKYYNRLMDQAKRLYQIYQECKINIEEKEYMESFKPHMVDLTVCWCQGQSFAQICKMTNLYEGSIIRCLRRLDELLKQLQNACKVINNSELQNKFEEASKKLKRGIVFAASLYL